MAFSWDVKRKDGTQDNAEWARHRGIPSVTPSLSRASEGGQLAITQCVPHHNLSIIPGAGRGRH